MKTYISVCKNTVASNLKNGTRIPVLRISHGKYGKPQRADNFHLKTVKPASICVHYNPHKPMPWGARAWMEIEY